MKKMCNCLVGSLFLCVSLFSSVSADAENWYNRFDRAIRRFLMNGIDSTFINLPSTSWEIPIVANTYGDFEQLTFDSAGIIKMNSGAIPEVGVGIGYHGLDYVQSFSLSRNNVYQRYFAFDFYDNYWGVQIITSDKQFKDKGTGVARTTLGGYFAFNGKQYSYPAAYYGNYAQLRSAGSPMIYLWYEQTREYGLDGNRYNIPTSVETMWNIALCGGYGHNWVFSGGKFLINFSAAIGMVAPCWGFAAEARGSLMYWVCDKLHISLTGLNYFSQGSKDFRDPYSLDEWKATLSFTYCFGKIPGQNSRKDSVKPL